MTISITFHGHATFTVEASGVKLLIDPFFSGNPAAIISADEAAADYILLTHGHGDHVADAIAIAKRTGATAIANFEIVTWLNNNGIDKAHAQHIGGGFNHPFGRVKLTPALHGSMLPDGSNGGMAGGFLLSIAGKNIYIAGDTALFSDMSLIGNAGIDLAIIPIGDNFTMGTDDAIEAVKLLNPKQVVPCHYNTWPPIEQDGGAWAERVKAETNAEPILMAAEDSIEI